VNCELTSLTIMQRCSGAGTPETMRQDKLRKRFSEYAEIPEGPTLLLPLDIPVLKSFKLRWAKAP